MRISLQYVINTLNDFLIPEYMGHKGVNVAKVVTTM